MSDKLVTINHRDFTEAMFLLEQSLKHLRRVTVVYAKCHPECLCNGVCENPDVEKTFRLEQKIFDMVKKMSERLNQ